MISQLTLLLLMFRRQEYLCRIVSQRKKARQGSQAQEDSLLVMTKPESILALSQKMNLSGMGQSVLDHCLLLVRTLCALYVDELIFLSSDESDIDKLMN